jgi:Tetratricopeptide repeat
VTEVAGLISSVLSGMDQRDVAIRFQKAALERRANTLDPSHAKSRASLLIMADISMFLAQDGKLEEAENIANDALLGLKAYNKPAGPGTLMAMRALAFVYRARWQIKESEKIFQRILSLQEEHRGPENNDTVESVGRPCRLIYFLPQVRQGDSVVQYARAQRCWRRRSGQTIP